AAQVFEEGIDAEQAAGAVDEQQGLATTGDFHFDGPLAVAQFVMGLHYFAELLASAAAALRPLPLGLPLSTSSLNDTGAGIASSLSGSRLGDQRSSNSLHRSRRCGITSRANNSVFLRVNSGGIEPICSSSIRWPHLRLLIASRRRSRTVLGEPAIT